MELLLKSTMGQDFGTLGFMFIDKKLQCMTLEDPWHMVKQKGDTRIPAGTYELVLNEVLTPLTEKYREDYPFFDWHIMLKDVPNYENVYIHVGNSKKDTQGCILVGDNIVNPNKTSIPLQASGNAFKDFYKKVAGHLRNGGNATITIER